MLSERWRSWGTDGTWYGWLLVIGVSAVVLWAAIGVLRPEADDDWESRGSPALAWTGERLFVYGGNPVPAEGESVRTLQPLNDAALIDPTEGNVRVLPEPPFDRPMRVQPAAVAVGEDVLVVGQLCREIDAEDRACGGGAYKAAVWDETDDRWREVELPARLQQISNGQSEPVGATSDGRAVVVLGARDGFGALANREIWTYDLDEDLWEALPSPGSFIEAVCLARDAVVVGSGLLAEAAATEGGTLTEGPTLRVLALDGEARVWFPTEPAAFTPVGDTVSMTCGDDLVMVDDTSPVKHVFDLGIDGGWRESAPQPGDDVHLARLWTGREFLFLDPNSPNLAYDPVEDAWRGLEDSAATGIRSVWTGESVVGWPGRTDLPVEFPVD